ncbi:MAG: Minichromosome maintenance protein MCM [Candidatus Heimdallarchaeota archaeon LC_3]|nr:MAG: Minichromosome maintenance protein MCM [Candidatus Heimdallarchaeota archaeon LC_3]
MNEEQYKSFFYEFRDNSGQPTYDMKIDKLIQNKKRSLEVSITDLQNFEILNPEVELTNPLLFPDAINGPKEAIKEAVKALKSIIREKDEEYLRLIKHRINLRFYSPPKGTIQVALKDIDGSYIGKLIELEAIVIRSDPENTILETGRFECLTCRSLIDRYFSDGEYQPPVFCEIQQPDGNNCSGRSFNLLKDDSDFVDIRRFEIQDVPENIEVGRSVKSISAYLRDDLVRKSEDIQIRDRIIFTCMVDTRPNRKMQRGQLATFDRFLEIIHFKIIGLEDKDTSFIENSKIIPLERFPLFGYHNEIVLNRNIGIYAITNIKLGTLYIGQSSDIKSRWGNHVQELNKENGSANNLKEEFLMNHPRDYEFWIIEGIKDDLLPNTENWSDEKKDYFKAFISFFLLLRESYWLNQVVPDLLHNVNINKSGVYGNQTLKEYFIQLLTKLGNSTIF